MKYIKPHLSPELRAQITPARRRDLRYTTAGIFFLVCSILLSINLLTNNSTTLPVNNKPEIILGQSQNTSSTNEPQKQVLGAATSEAVEQAQYTEYKVKSGDTLFNISQQYNVKWDLIAQINNLSEPFVLHAGEILKIPQTTTSKVPGKIYTIKNGDTLVNIAKQFNITVDDIVAVNPNLQKSDLITIGQIIKLP